jgi:Periplasmic binding protein
MIGRGEKRMETVSVIQASCHHVITNGSAAPPLDVRHLFTCGRGPRAIVDEGGKKWFFLQADYNLGETMVRDASQVIAVNGGQTLGRIKHPFPNVPFQTLAEAVRSANEDMLITNASEEFKEGYRAFLEKRRPNFTAT